MSMPLLTSLNQQGREIGAIVYHKEPVNCPWVSLLAGASQGIAIPDGMRFVRFAYDQGGHTVYSSPETITVPAGGATESSITETNAVIRDISDFVERGFTQLNLLSTADTTVHLYFYSK